VWFNQAVNPVKRYRFARLSDLAALIISLAALFSTAWTTDHIFERIPHLEDEMAYVWEAKAIVGGKIQVPSPECIRCFLFPFIIDYEGSRFGKYPLGWPAVLSLGIHLGIRHLVNPLLGASAVWLTYLLGKKLFSPGVGLIAAFLTTVSPFFVMNTGSLLSHTWGLFLTLTLLHGWLDTFFPGLRNQRVPAALAASVATLSLGLLALSRPLTAVAVGLPFGIHGLWLLVTGSGLEKRRVVGIGLGTGLIACLHFVWQFALTGNALINPYTLWWSYDTIGFGPGIGLQPGGFSPLDAWANTRFSLTVLSYDLFGWPYLSLLFLPFGLWAARKSAPAWLLFSIFPSVVLGYGLYWITSWLYGPRYYFEALPVLTLLSALGIAWCMGLIRSKIQSLKQDRKRSFAVRHGRPVVVSILVTTLLVANILYYLPARIPSFHGLYGVSAKYIQPFLQPETQAITPALIIVHKQISWYEYGTLLDLESPYLDTPYVFIHDPSTAEEERIIAQFPGRSVFHYYHDEPYHLYSTRRD